MGHQRKAGCWRAVSSYFLFPFKLLIGYALPMLPDIKSLTREELDAQFKTWDVPVYRVTQVLEWLYVRRVTDWDAMTNLPKGLREKLREHFSLQTMELVRKQGSPDTTQKFLWRLSDHSLIESVLIPANPALYGEASDRHTLCISTQVGCAYGCKFCASGLEGWKRNLLPHEIIEQVLSTERFKETNSKLKIKNSKFASALPLSPESKVQGPKFEEAGEDEGGKVKSRFVDNLVIMGMGEPLANY